ncbi:MAG: hypothetical protein GXY07_11520 [Candidatus Hydrogenedentes bacterium]|nr:hypothetical protein [Candidatus Hydrogenedentota bacterium]
MKYYKMSIDYLVALVIFIVWEFYTFSALAQQPTIEQTITGFFNTVFNIEVTKIVEKPGIKYYAIGLPYKYVVVNNKYTSYISVDCLTIYHYSNSNWMTLEADSVRGKTHADRISEDEAFTSIVPLLAHFSCPTEKSSFEAVFRDTAVESNREDLFGACWTFRREILHNGIPCRTRYFSISVSAASGNIIMFDNCTKILPLNTNNSQVSFTAAQQIAFAWLMAEPYFANKSPTIDTSNTQGQIVIAPKRNWVTDTDLLSEALTTYYSWEVLYTYIEDGQIIPTRIWINVETGEVVGL